MNHHGQVPGDPFADVWPPPEFRSTFQAKYYLIDFGCAVQFPPTSEPRKRLARPFQITRVQKAPEIGRLALYDPFAADVYSLARLFYGYFKVLPSPLMDLDL
jgi:hypothetical protein